jgi:hypothetical protein
MINVTIPYPVLKAALGAMGKHEKREFLNFFYLTGDRRVVATNGADITYASHQLDNVGVWPPTQEHYIGFYMDKGKVCDSVQIVFNPQEGQATATGLKKDQVVWVEELVVQGVTCNGQIADSGWSPLQVSQFVESLASYPQHKDQGVPLVDIGWKLLKYLKDLECKENKKTGLRFSFCRGRFIYIKLPHGGAVLA